MLNLQCKNTDTSTARKTSTDGKTALNEERDTEAVWQNLSVTWWKMFQKGLFVQGSRLRASLSVTKQRQWSATALTPKLLNIFSSSAITSHFSPVSWQPNITPPGEGTEIQYYKPPPRACCLITIRGHGNRLLEWVITVISIWGAWRRAHLGDGEVRDSMFYAAAFAWIEFADIWGLCKS